MTDVVRVELPAGAVEAVVVRPGDLLVVRLKPGGIEAFAEDWETHRPAGLENPGGGDRVRAARRAQDVGVGAGAGIGV